MKVVRTISEMRQIARGYKRAGQKIGLVPTMGSLHDGHLSLVKAAAESVDHVVVSIFVNPTQFGPNEDFEDYPRDLTADVDQLETLQINCIVFAPATAEMYPGSESLTWVETLRMADTLCGITRPGHFRGVQTVVTKLFNICKPHVAVFGLKDVQQFLIIQRMVMDLNMDLEIIGVPTAREPDGLALSSRNQYLTAEERQQATILFTAVSEARRGIEAGEKDVDAIMKTMQSTLRQARGGRIDYAQIVRASDLAPAETLRSGEQIVAAVAVYFNRARLIDNAIVDVP